MIFFRIYQILIAIPLMVVLTVIAVIITLSTLLVTGGRYGGYWASKLWGASFCILNFVRVKVKNRDYIDRKTQYVFVANHQGAFDIFAVYGFLHHSFRWMMKKSLEKVPLVGFTCKMSGHVYVDSSSPSAIRQTMTKALTQLRGSRSLVVFPEGSRTPDGKMHDFKRGAFMLAAGLGLPIVPLTIDGAYKVMPKSAKLPRPGRIIITIHHPILPVNGRHNTAQVLEESYKAIASSLPE